VPIVNEVYVTGEVRVPGRVTYSPALTVAEYLLAAGGIVKETGNPESIWFVDADGGRIRATTSSAVTPGTIIYVDRNAWTKTQETFTNVTIVTGFVAAIVAFVATIANFWITYLAP
jgi:protein involved in polysaccharide export with SLBB domain